MDSALSFPGEAVALVTGAASGIGLATARRLAMHGVRRFVLVDRDTCLDAAISELPGEKLGFVCDVSDEVGWCNVEQAIRTRFDGIDLCIVNAGVAGASVIAELDFAEWRRILSVNLDGAFLTLRAAMRLMRAGGAVVMVSSAAGIKAEPGVGAYASSKAGVIQLAKVAAKEGALNHIRVNVIAPGGVETAIWRGVPFFQELVIDSGSERAAYDAMASQATPLGRFAIADEIAGQIAFLLSPAAATITGAVLTSDGGYTL